MTSVVSSDHATASAGVSACTSLQGLHAECVASSQRTLVLLEQATVSVGFTSTSNLTMSTLQVLAASLEALGRYTDAIQYVHSCTLGVCTTSLAVSPQVHAEAISPCEEGSV